MKNTLSAPGILLVYSLFAFFSCTKNNEVNSPALSQSKASSRLLSNADALGTTVFAPGDSLVVKGDTSNGDETILLQTYAPDTNRINFISFVALGPSLSGNYGIDRSIIKFKLRHVSDSIRNNPPQIQKAMLYLYQYHRPADQDPYTNFQSGDNSAELHRIISDWNSQTVSWNNKPVLANGSANPLEDVVIIPPVTTPLPAGTNDNQELDVTDMVRKIISSRNNEGFLLKLTLEHTVFGRSYGSFACPDRSKRPKLVLYF